MKVPLTHAQAANRAWELEAAWAVIKTNRDRVRRVGAHRAADALSRALKSLEGAVKHARRLRDQA